MESKKISDGVFVHGIQSQKFKTTTLCVLLRQPLTRENATINAILPALLQRGCAKYPSVSKMNQAVEDLYGGVFHVQVVKKGEMQIIQFYLEFLRNVDGLKEQALDFIREVMLNPLVKEGGFVSEYVESEKENLRIEIESRINNKAEYAKLKCLEEMCRDEPFGVYGDGYVEDLDTITPQSAFQQYQKVLETSPIDFVVIGADDLSFYEDSIKNNFDIKRGAVVAIPKAAFSIARKETRKVIEQHDILQGKICVGIRTGIDPCSEDFYRLMVANEIFGGGGNSRLFRNVREKESLCYYISSFVYTFKTIVLIQSGVESKNFDRVMELVQRELDALKSDKVSGEDLENAKNGLRKKYVGLQDHPAAIIDFHVSQLLLGEPATIQDVLDRINSVKKRDVCSVVERFTIDTIFLLQGMRA